MKDTTISHFRVLRLIGKGGMSEVYLAEDERLRRKVALKLLPALRGADRERELRFEQEARAASALNHPNIVTVYDVGEEEGRRYIATEWIDGDTLRERIERGPIPLETVLDVVSGIAAALAAAHKVGIIHRDIKPENVMIRNDGLVKVLDFGLAKLTESVWHASDGSHQLTEPGLVMGTVEYMSPEQLKGADVDARTDLFSLGEVLYEMLTGRNPFEAPSTSQVIAGILEREPDRIEPRSGTLPPPLGKIVERALQKEPDQRYGSADEMLSELRQLRTELDFEKYERRSSAGTRVGGSPSGSGPVFRSGDVEGGRVSSESGQLVQGIRSNRDLLLGIALLLTILTAAYLYFSRDQREYDSIAVLPFANLGPSADIEYLSDGLTESVIHSLSRVQRLDVMAPSSVFRYKQEPDIDPREAGRQLRVEAVVTGAVQKQGDMLVVRADLVDVDRGTILWGQQYYRRASDLLFIQREIAEEISSKLRLRLTGAEMARMASSQPSSPGAYEEYLRGRYWWNRRTDAGLRKAIEHFSRSVEEDPSFALPYAGLADAYNLMPVYGMTRSSDAFPRAKAAAHRALALDESLAEAHTSLAWVHMNYDWDWAAAEERFRRAIELNPSYATAHHWYSLFLSAMGRNEDALAEARRAQALDPLSPVIQLNVGTIYYQAGRMDEAITQFEQTLAMTPEFRRGRFELARALEVRGNPKAAIPIFEELAGDGDAEEHAALARALARAGRRDEAEELLKRITSEEQWGYANPYSIAAVYVALQDHDAAFEWLDRAFEQHVSRLVYLDVEPMFRSLRGDQRFMRLRSRLKLPPRSTQNR